VETPGLTSFQSCQLALRGKDVLNLTADADQGTGPAVTELSDLAIVLADAFVEPSQDIWAQCLSGIPDELFPVHGVHTGSRPVLKRSRSSMSKTERSVLNKVMG
jgi:hypothetical protein